MDEYTGWEECSLCGEYFPTEDMGRVNGAFVCGECYRFDPVNW